MTGFQLFAKDGTKLFETGWTGAFGNSFKPQETILQDNERIIGMKARNYGNGSANYDDF